MPPTRIAGYVRDGLDREVTHGKVQLCQEWVTFRCQGERHVFTASRLLSRWQRDGMLSKGRDKIVLRSPEHLLRYAA